MTLEQALATLAINTGRIADALEASNEQRGVVADTPEDTTTRKDVDDALENVRKKTAKKLKAEKAKKAKETVVGKTDDETPEWDLKGIRTLLHQLQEQENQAAVKSALKKFGASTLGQVDKKKFAQLAAHIEKLIDD